jgi:SAM-dependent methyltransferase
VRFVFPTSPATYERFRSLLASMPKGAFIERPMGGYSPADQARNLTAGASIPSRADHGNSRNETRSGSFVFLVPGGLEARGSGAVANGNAGGSGRDSGPSAREGSGRLTARFRFDPDEQVQRAIRLVFERFRLDGSAYAVARYCARHGLPLPARAVPTRELRWGPARPTLIGGILHNPAGCGTGFLTFELAARGHHVIGVDFAPSMLAEARRKAAARGASVRFEEADAEQLPFPPGSFDLAISRHLLWTLSHPDAAIDEWIRVLRPGGRLVVVDGQFDAGAAPPSSENARTSQEYAAIGDQLPFLGGRPREDIETLLKAHGLVNVGSDPLLDLVAAQEQRMVEEGRERRTRRRYVVWGDVPR